MRYVQPLTDEQRAFLENTMQEDTVFRARSRAHSLLLSAVGTPIKAIAEAYQVHRVTVSAWIKQWEHDGAQSLHDQPRSGRPPTLTPDAQELAKHSSPKFLPAKKGILLILLQFRGNGISGYWEQQPEEFESPLLERCGCCELRERETMRVRRDATAVTAAGPEGGQEGREAVDGQPIRGQTDGLFLLRGA